MPCISGLSAHEWVSKNYLLQCKKGMVIFCAQGRFLYAKGLSYFGSCGTQGICSNKYPSDILAAPVLSLRSTGVPKIREALWLKSSFAQKLPFLFLSQ